MDHGPDRLTRAEALLRDVQGRPAEGQRAALALLAECGDDEAAVVALRALGLAERILGDLTQGISTLRRAVKLGTRLALPHRVGQVRVSLMVHLAERGHTDAALREAALATAVLEDLDQARLQVNLGLVLSRIGRADEALACYAKALPVLRSRADTRWECILLSHRGIQYAYRGDHQAAEADLLRCIELSRTHGYHVLHAGAVENLGFAYLQAGDIPRSLVYLDQARSLLDALGHGTPGYFTDKAEALLLAGLGREARETISELITGTDLTGFEYNLAEAHLMLARAALVDEDAAAALEAARTARTAFTRQRRTAWASWARHMETSARFALGERTPSLIREALRAAEQMRAAGWIVGPQQARLVAARTASELGRGEQADTLFAEVARLRTRGPAELRATAWHAQALRQLASKRHAATHAALRAGLRVVAENAATLGATDLRAHSAVNSEEMATLGLRLAIERRSARSVLRWSESWRAAALRQRPVRPPNDEELAAALSDLRRVADEINRAGVEGRDATRARAELLRLERTVRDLSRHARGTYAPEPPFDIATLASELGKRAFVEYLQLDGVLHAVTLVDGHCRLHRLGPYESATTELEKLRFALRRMAEQFGSPMVRAAGKDAYDYGRRELDQLLFGRIGSVVGDRDLVVVPTGGLHALPWSALPTCEGRPVAVAPSARTWVTSMRAAAHRTGRGTVLVSGPGLEHAEPEIAALAQRYPSATRLSGAAARASDVGAALDGADLAHIAAHGSFRTDNPLFSALALADGPLTVYDLERLERAPRQLVLSACDSGLSGIRPGNELMGLASAVFALGTTTLIASVTPVNDAESLPMMLDLHDRLHAGIPAAEALVASSATTGVAGFVCFGAG